MRHPGVRPFGSRSQTLFWGAGPRAHASGYFFRPSGGVPSGKRDCGGSAGRGSGDPRHSRPGGRRYTGGLRQELRVIPHLQRQGMWGTLGLWVSRLHSVRLRRTLPGAIFVPPFGRPPSPSPHGRLRQTMGHAGDRRTLADFRGLIRVVGGFRRLIRKRAENRTRESGTGSKEGRRSHSLLRRRHPDLSSPLSELLF